MQYIISWFVNSDIAFKCNPLGFAVIVLNKCPTNGYVNETACCSDYKLNYGGPHT